jgi:hypothetical protein
LTEILIFPRAWYRRSLVRTSFKPNSNFWFVICINLICPFDLSIWFVNLICQFDLLIWFVNLICQFDLHQFNFNSICINSIFINSICRCVDCFWVNSKRPPFIGKKIWKT